ncbi:MAG: hypothetical protein ACD_62C00602G0001, partial [uncultured bacterium]
MRCLLTASGLMMDRVLCFDMFSPESGFVKFYKLNRAIGSGCFYFFLLIVSKRTCPICAGFVARATPA